MPDLRRIGTAVAIFALAAILALLTWWFATLFEMGSDLNDACNVPKHPETRCD